MQQQLQLQGVWSLSSYGYDPGRTHWGSNWLVGSGWLVDLLVGWLAGSDWLAGWLVGSGWLAGWLVGWPCGTQCIKKWGQFDIKISLHGSPLKQWACLCQTEISSDHMLMQPHPPEATMI